MALHKLLPKEQANEWVEHIIDYVEFLGTKHQRDYYKFGLGQRIVFNIGFAVFSAALALKGANIKEGANEYKKFSNATLSILKHPDIFTNEHKNKILYALSEESSHLKEFDHQKVNSEFSRLAGRSFMQLLKTMTDEKKQDHPISITTTQTSEEEARNYIRKHFTKLPAFLSSSGVSDENFDINETDDCRFTQLSWAANLGADRLVHKYLEAEADPNIIDRFGGTAFSRAAFRGHTEVIRELIKSKSYLGLDRNEGGWRFAFLHVHHDLVELLMKQPGFDIHSESVQKSFLQISAGDGEKHQEVLSLFIANGISKATLSKGLLVAATKNAEKNALQLLAAGADVNFSEFGKTPLDFASHNQNISLASQFLLAGAKIQDLKLLDVLFELKHKKRHSTFFRGKVYPDECKPLDDFQAYICLSKICEYLELMLPDTFTEKVYRKAKSFLEEIKIRNKMICDQVNLGTYKKLPDAVLSIIDEYNHPHGHKPF